MFGGFSVLPFDISGTRKNDKRSFVFTLKNPHNFGPCIFLPRVTAGPVCSLAFGPTYGAVAGYSDIQINDDSHNNGGYSYLGSNAGYMDTSGYRRELFTGNAKLERISDIVAFKV